ncbi:T9SS type A sorting domain-containing protein, partial [Hwangdonia sp.]
LKSKKDLTNKKNYTLNIPNLKNGMYYLKVITEKHTEVHRILVDR